jgi:hypothetical protein
MVTYSTHASLLVYEGFDISAGPINGDSGATSFGWSGNWVASQNGHVVTHSLVYVDAQDNELCTVGNRVHETQGDPVSRSFASTYSSGTYWYSFLANGNNQTHDAQMSILTSGGPSIDLNFSLDSSNDPIWTLAVGGSTTSTAVQSDFSGLNPALLLVMRIDLNAAPNSDAVYFYENPLLSGEPGTGTALLTLTGLNLFPLSGSLFDVDGNGLLRFDEVRLGTTFADVAPICCDDCNPVPEPSTIGLGLIGGLALAWRMRRRRA